MSKKGWKAGAVIAAGAGITAVLAAKKRGKQEKDQTKKTSHGNRSDFRNTELGKHDKNSRHEKREKRDKHDKTKETEISAKQMK